MTDSPEIIQARREGWKACHESHSRIIGTRAKYRLSDDLIELRDTIDAIPEAAPSSISRDAA